MHLMTRDDMPVSRCSARLSDGYRTYRCTQRVVGYNEADGTISLQHVTHSFTRIPSNFIVACNTVEFQSPSKRRIITLVASYWRKCHKNKLCKGENVRPRTVAEWSACQSWQQVLNCMSLYSKTFFFKHSGIFSTVFCTAQLSLHETLALKDGLHHCYCSVHTFTSWQVR